MPRWDVPVWIAVEAEDQTTAAVEAAKMVTADAFTVEEPVLIDEEGCNDAE